MRNIKKIGPRSFNSPFHFGLLNCIGYGLFELDPKVFDV
jgi:hypothetical protein